VNELIDNQVRSLRVRQVIGSYEARPDDLTHRKGTYFGIRTNITAYRTPGALPCPVEQTIRLAMLKTRLKRLDGRVPEQLINWGYAICDAAMRRWVEPALPAPRGFPYPTSGVG
jgi:NTE family protein